MSRNLTRSRMLVAAFVLAVLGVCTAAPAASAPRTVLVRNAAEYKAALPTLRPGDTLVLADGEWRDAQLLFTGKGRPDRPITLTAQTAGKVILSGQSNLRLAGEHLVVANLVFRDGWSPTGEVVAFRRNRAERANHSRATGIVIDAFNKPDRAQSDNWVALYGHDNRFDHGHLVGKTNLGTTLVVVRDAEQGFDNRHRIDHNWFGPRPNLGSNGGETIRVGTSHDSLSDSHTVVEDNWFEHCDGEVEIVSNKSGANVYRRNVFFESRGALVLRHGDGNLVEDNVFLGNGKPHTGGVRVINRRQTVRNNYFEGLAGEGFASALGVMYGVPDSPLNRYTQVDGAVIERNTFVNVRGILLGLGRDAERSLAPVGSRFAHNLIVGGTEPVRVLGDVSGIAFEGNVQSPRAPAGIVGGFSVRAVPLTRGADGLSRTEEAVDAGARRDLRVVPRAGTGASWYPKRTAPAALDAGDVRDVAPGEDTLTVAVAQAAAGDRLQLSEGRYLVNQVLPVDRPLSVVGPERGTASILFSRPTLFDVAARGSLRLARLDISGELAPDEASNAVIRARPGSGAANYRLLLEDLRIRDLDVNRAFDVVSAGKGSMADLIALRRVEVEDATGSVVSAAAETDDRGTYNAERVEIEDSHFVRVGGAAVDLYRGGSDESTFGPKLRIAGTQFERVGAAAKASLRLHGVQHVELTGNRFVDSAAIAYRRTVGEPVLIAERNVFERTSAFEATGAAR